MSDNEILIQCVNKELERYGITYESVKKGGPNEYTEENNILVPWYEYYTFNSKEEFEEWEKYCIELIKKSKRTTVRQAKRIFTWLNLSYGLRTKYDN